MKNDVGSNCSFVECLAAKSYTAGAQTMVSVDHALAPSASYFISAGTFGSSATLNAKLQYSEDNSNWTDEPDTTAGNDTAITEMTAAGNAQLNCPNPRGRYSRVLVTTAVEAVVCGVTGVLGPLRKVAV